jgi:hypothetical protein
LESIDGVETEAGGIEERGFVADVIGAVLEHQFLDHGILDFVLERVVRHKAQMMR